MQNNRDQAPAPLRAIFDQSIHKKGEYVAYLPLIGPSFAPTAAIRATTRVNGGSVETILAYGTYAPKTRIFARQHEFPKLECLDNKPKAVNAFTLANIQCDCVENHWTDFYTQCEKYKLDCLKAYSPTFINAA